MRSTHHKVNVAVVIDEALHQLLKAVLFSGHLGKIKTTFLELNVFFNAKSLFSNRFDVFFFPQEFSFKTIIWQFGGTCTHMTLVPVLK